MRQKTEDEAVRERLGRAIRRLRAERNLSRRELERRTGLSYPYLSEIEGGKKSPSSKTLRVIADVLGLEVHKLMEIAERGGGPGRSHFHGAPGEVAYSIAEPEPLHSEAVAAAPPPRPMSPQDPLVQLMSVARALGPEDMALLIDLANRLRR
ncbi:MAG TPA: helix-turn-helix transcriptional regulator [Actinomycetota bacterium]|nr:helix-turn-helix transcriptional regulator [Actinomycetota bacterium]